jgi:hypothetical protein
MTNGKILRFAVAACFAVTFVVPSAGMAQDGKLPNGGQPPPGSAPSVKDFDYQIKYQRAF